MRYDHAVMPAFSPTRSALAVDRERVRALLDAAVRVYSPSYQEGPIIDLFRRALQAADLPTRLQPVDGAVTEDPSFPRGNIIVEIGPQPPALLLIGHLDTIQLGEGEEMSTEWRGDTLHALGAADMKGGCVAMVEALIAITGARRPFDKGVALALVVGEEDVGDGAKALVCELSAPLVVIGEPTNLAPCGEHFGYLELELVVRGRRAHAALPEAGVNAIHAMQRWLLEVERVCGVGGALGDVNPNVRSILGGGELFVVPDQCRAVLDLHLPPGQSREYLEQVVRECFGRSRPEDGTEASVERITWAPGYDVKDAAMAKVASAMAAADHQKDARAFRSHSDGSHFHAEGIQPVLWGPGRLDVAHTHREHVRLDDVVRAAELYAQLVDEVCLGARDRG